MGLLDEGGDDEPLLSPEFREHLREILEGETLENKAALEALQRCIQASTFKEIVDLREATRRTLAAETDNNDKRYLFSYFSQLERVVSQAICLPKEGGYDA